MTPELRKAALGADPCEGHKAEDVATGAIIPALYRPDCQDCLDEVIHEILKLAK